MKYDEIVKSHPLVLVDFYADWCGPCKMMVPVFKELKHKLGGQVKVIKIDTERNQSLSSSMGIRSIPTMVLYKNGLKCLAATRSDAFECPTAKAKGVHVNLSSSRFS